MVGLMTKKGGQGTVGEFDPFKASWGKITIESVVTAKKIVVHVFNHDLQSEANILRNLSFVSSRVKYAATAIPPGFAQHVMFDDRGQDVSDSVRDRIKNALRSQAAWVSFISKGERPPGLD